MQRGRKGKGERSRQISNSRKKVPPISPLALPLGRATFGLRSLVRVGGHSPPGSTSSAGIFSDVCGVNSQKQVLESRQEKAKRKREGKGGRRRRRGEC